MAEAIGPNLVVTGMMASGKTAVGKRAAEVLGWPFIDLDERIAARAGHSVADIFAREGEASFRRREREALIDMASLRGHVLATGGFTVGEPGNVRRLAALGPVVCLTASPATLARRLAGSPRPPLASATAEAVTELVALRARVYAELPLHVTTDDRTVDDVAFLVLELARALGGFDVTAISVAGPGLMSRFLSGSGLLGALGRLVLCEVPVARAAVVTDTTVGGLYGPAATAALRGAGIEAETLTLSDGESSKSLLTVADLYQSFARLGLERFDAVLALGGGVVGDTAGFAAATYLRGMQLVHVPTTLLAMVDASIGGKTGVNLPTGKNQVGAFYGARLTVADPAVLSTLPLPELRAGMAEVVKAALISDPELFAQIDRRGDELLHDRATWPGLVARAAEVKALIVSRDAFDVGVRETLNLGHTFAHALESATNYRLSHGEAVSVGLVASTRLARRLDLAPAHLPERVERILGRMGLPTSFAGPTVDDVIAAMAADKKRRAGTLRFVLPREVGEVEVVSDVPESAVEAVLYTLRQRTH